jgi:hypothetical protein
MTLLTPKDLQHNVDSWFQQFRGEHGCVACGRRDLALGDTIVSDVLPKGESKDNRKSLPMVQIVCRTCGYIHMLRASEIFGVAGPG